MDGSTFPKPEPEEAFPEAAALLKAAGWLPHDEWHVYTRGTLVMGFSPCRKYFDVKNWAKDVHGPDYPDDPVEAAQWLIRLRALPAVVLVTEATLDTSEVNEVFSRETEAEHPLQFDLGEDAAETPVTDEAPALELESDHELRNETDLGSPDPSVREQAGDAGEGPPGGMGEHGRREDDWAEQADDLGDTGHPAAAVFDADFGDPEPEHFDLGEEADYQLSSDDYARHALETNYEPPASEATEEAPGSQFIFGDNLDQMRTAAIGLVMRHARTLMPFWTTDSDTALIELRNFAMGVAEGRWADDAGRKEELQTLEATLSRITAITSARDAKVEFLESASREEIEAFDHEAGWP